MKFELSIAGKYLLPRKGRLALSLISLLSTVVIALVVWLILTFLSVTEGIEKGWQERLTALYAPLQIIPTENYYQSYYYQIDSYSSLSGYTSKSLEEKKESPLDPYDPDIDPPLPSSFPSPEKERNLVSLLFQTLENYPDITFQSFETSAALFRLHLKNTTLSQMTYLCNPPTKSPLYAHVFEPEGKKMDSSSVYLPKSYQEAGAKVGDKGSFSYWNFTLGGVQEMQRPVEVAGFYDPGIMAVGIKFVFTAPETVRSIAQASSLQGAAHMNGLRIWTSDLSKVDDIKAALEEKFRAQHLDTYWKVVSYKEYDFAKDLLHQFQSDRILFTMIGSIILIVACCNIISLLVILVNDKKKEVGILLSMGASKKSLAFIFMCIGTIMGTTGAFLGTVGAFFTLHYIDQITQFLSHLQGHAMFNSAFYGQSLPHLLSSHSLLFIFIATPLFSVLAGLVPTLKACRLNPSSLLRYE